MENETVVIRAISTVKKNVDLSNLVKLRSGSSEKSGEVDMFTVSFFLWTVLRSIFHEIDVESRRGSHRNSLVQEKERRDSKENFITLIHSDRRRSRVRRHSRKYYFERNKRWVYIPGKLNLTEHLEYKKYSSSTKNLRFAQFEKKRLPGKERFNKNIWDVNRTLRKQFLWIKKRFL